MLAAAWDGLAAELRPAAASFASLLSGVVGRWWQGPASTVTAGALSQAVEVSSVTNSLGGTTTTYMIPTATLPLLTPLQQIGVPAPILNGLNQLLTPIVNEGYSQYDPSGGPYFSHGNLV
jgi:PPE-repeat protein